MWHNPLVWVVVALAVYAIAVNVYWAYPLDGAQRYVPIARIAYLVGLPVLALALRAMQPAELGLAPPRSLVTAVAATGIAAGVAALVIGARRWYGRAAGEASTRSRWPITGLALAEIALDAFLRESHWAFVRAGALAATGPDLGRASVVAVVLLALEAWSDPSRRTAFRTARAAHGLTRGAALTIMSGMVFATSASSILAWGLHVPVAGVWRLVLGDAGTDSVVEPAAPARHP